MHQERPAPLFSNKSVITAGSFAVILIAGGVILRGVLLSEAKWPTFFANLNTATSIPVAADPPEPRMMYRSTDGVYSVEYGEEYEVDTSEARVLIRSSEQPVMDEETGIVIRAVAGNELDFAALRAAPEDADLSAEIASGSAIIKKLQNVNLNGYPAIEYLAKRDVSVVLPETADASEAAARGNDSLLEFAQVVLINADKAGFFEIANVANTREELQDQAEEHARVLSSFTVL